MNNIQKEITKSIEMLRNSINMVNEFNDYCKENTLKAVAQAALMCYYDKSLRTKFLNNIVDFVDSDGISKYKKALNAFDTLVFLYRTKLPNYKKFIEDEKDEKNYNNIKNSLKNFFIKYYEKNNELRKAFDLSELGPLELIIGDLD